MATSKRRARAPRVRKAAAGGFVELLAGDALAGDALAGDEAPGIELELRSGHRLRLTGRFDVEQVVHLARALESC